MIERELSADRMGGAAGLSSFEVLSLISTNTLEHPQHSSFGLIKTHHRLANGK